MKIGDKIVCKKNFNDDTNITINKSYKVIKISWPVYDEYHNYNDNEKGLKMLTIMGNRGLCNYWSDYFYNIKEERKLKLYKIYQKNLSLE
jgi:hypothetical protein